MRANDSGEFPVPSPPTGRRIRIKNRKKDPFKALLKLEARRLEHAERLSQQGIDVLTLLVREGSSLAREALEIQRQEVALRRDELQRRGRNDG